jgi:hypothetical protein
LDLVQEMNKLGLDKAEDEKKSRPRPGALKQRIREAYVAAAGDATAFAEMVVRL